MTAPISARIDFRDPDGCIVEIATRWPGMAEDEPEETLGTTYIAPPVEVTPGHRDEAAIAAQTWPEPVPALGPDMALGGLHHITAIGSDIARTTAFWTEMLGLRLVKQTGNYDDPAIPHYYYGVGDGGAGHADHLFRLRRRMQDAPRRGWGTARRITSPSAWRRTRDRWPGASGCWRRADGDAGAGPPAISARSISATPTGKSWRSPPGRPASSWTKP